MEVSWETGKGRSEGKVHSLGPGTQLPSLFWSAGQVPSASYSGWARQAVPLKWGSGADMEGGRRQTNR